MLVYYKPPAAPIVTLKGILQVTNAANGAILGFLSKNTFSRAQHRYQPDESDALIITFTAPQGARSVSQARITTLNSDTGFPLLGFVQGRDNTNSDIRPGSYHYGYFAGTNGGAPGAPPQTVGNSYSTVSGLSRTSESDVWTINIATGAVTGQWINTDGSKLLKILFIEISDRDANMRRLQVLLPLHSLPKVLPCTLAVIEPPSSQGFQPLSLTSSSSSLHAHNKK